MQHNLYIKTVYKLAYTKNACLIAVKQKEQKIADPMLRYILYIHQQKKLKNKSEKTSESIRLNKLY